MYGLCLIISDHENSLNKYMKLPKKKDNEKLRQEASDELYAMRRKFHQVSYQDSLCQIYINIGHVKATCVLCFYKGQCFKKLMHLPVI